MPSLFLKPSTFRFDMGLRRGALDYFQNAGPASLLDERRALLQSCPDNYVASLPGSEVMVQEVAEFATQVGHSILTAPSSQVADSSPCLTHLGTIWEPDFVLLDEALRVQAGCVCFPSFWSLPEKLGQPIDLVHAPVPGLNEELGAKIRTFLHKLKPGEVWERWNWGLTATPRLNCHPALQHPRLDASATIDTTWFRVEHQALVRLPKTQAILFSIRVSVSTLREEINAAPDFAATLRQQLQTMPAAVSHYKGLSACRDQLAQQLP